MNQVRCLRKPIQIPSHAGYEEIRTTSMRLRVLRSRKGHTDKWTPHPPRRKQASFASTSTLCMRVLGKEPGEFGNDCRLENSARGNRRVTGATVRNIFLQNVLANSLPLPIAQIQHACIFNSLRAAAGRF